MKKIKKLKTAFLFAMTCTLSAGTAFAANNKCEHPDEPGKFFPTLQEYYGAGGDVCMNLTAGGSGGSYVGIFGEGFSRYMERYGFGFYEVIFSKGSYENLVRIAKGESSFGLAQKDVQLYIEYKFDGKIPEGESSEDGAEVTTEELKKFRFENVRFVSELVDECVYVAYNKKKSTRTINDLKKVYNDPNQRPNIDIGERGSGSFYTWSFISSLNPMYGYADGKKKFYGMGKKLGGFKQGIKELKDPSSKTEAVMWVVNPESIKIEDSNINKVLADKDLDIMDFGDPSLTEKLTPELLERDPKAKIERINKNSATAQQPTQAVGAQDLLAESLLQFNDTKISTADTAPVMNLSSDSSAYHMRTVSLKEGSPKQIQTICTRAALYAHKNLLDPKVKIKDDFDINFTAGGKNEGMLWGETLGLIQDLWAEIVSSD